jgi:5-hydroxyisourate hydrolase-like protein (transthyretin family)
VRTHIFALGVLLLCLLLVPGVLIAEEEGIIEGQVMNGTADAPADSVAGLEVALYDVTDDSVELVATSISDSEGRFRFEGLATDEERAYRFELEYQGIVYGAQSSFPSGDTILHVVATIYETTSGDDLLLVARHHMILDFASDAVTVRELYIFDNTGDRIYVGEAGLTLRFSLPENAGDLAFGDVDTGAGMAATVGGFASTRRIPPGQTQVLYSYSVPYDGSHLTLPRTILYPTGNVDLLVPSNGVQVETGQLAYDGLTTAGDDTYLHFDGVDLARDTTIEIRLSGSPQGAVVPLSSVSPLLVAVRGAAPAIALGLALLGGLLPFLQLRVGRRESELPAEGEVSEPEAAAETEVESDADREELLRLIADLDDAYAEGLVKEKAYRQLRDKMKKRLRSDWTE